MAVYYCPIVGRDGLRCHHAPACPIDGLCRKHCLEHKMLRECYEPFADPFRLRFPKGKKDLNNGLDA